VATTGARAAEPDTERLSPVRQRRFTLAEYHRMIETGILGEDEHLELLEGEIVQMSPQDKPHARALTKLTRWFVRSLGDEYAVRPQLPLTLSDSEPEPDLAVVRAEEDAAAERHPRTALLVIEVADSSARRDLEVKARIYARAGIPEYWLVLVKQRAVEVLSDPDSAAGVYRSARRHSDDSTVAPAAFAGLVIPVATLFD
jgi:Uma2 family endonuclease